MFSKLISYLSLWCLSIEDSKTLKMVPNETCSYNEFLGATAGQIGNRASEKYNPI